MAKKVEKQKTDFVESPNVVVKLPKKLFLYVFTLLIVAGLIYLVGKVMLVATVNGEMIDRISVIKQLEKQGGKKVLDTVIVKALVKQEAKKRKVNVTDDEVQSEISKIEKNVVAQGTTVDALLEQQGMTKKDLQDDIKLQLLVTKMVDKNFTITDKEIEDYISSQKDLPSVGGAPAQAMTKDQAKEALNQQKIQSKIQTFIADLKSKAKISYFIKY